MTQNGRNGRRRRVLHVIQNLNYGGMERLLGDLVRGLDAREFESHVLVLQYLGRFASGLEEYATLHSPPPMPRWSLLWPRELTHVIRSIAPDVVHSHSGVWYKTSLAARLAGVPRIIHTEHGRAMPDPWSGRVLDGLASRRTSTAVAVSDSVADILDARVVRGRCSIEVVLNGVDTGRFRPAPDTGKLRGELGLDAATPIIGSVGRLEWVKGYDVMIDAFARLMARSDLPIRPVLVVAGDGSQRPLLERQIAAHGLSDSVHLLGWRDDIHDLMSAFACFTMSSRSEGTSVSLLEAMSSELCPVVTDVGGNRAVLGPDLVHRIAPSGGTDTLASIWWQILVGPDDRAADAALARARVQAVYSADAMLAAYREIYLQDNA